MLPKPATINIQGTTYDYPAGIYTSTPTLWNTPKDLTLIADLSGHEAAALAQALREGALTQLPEALRE